MNLVEVALFIVLCPLFAHLCVLGKASAEREYQKYLEKSAEIYAEREIVNSFRDFCANGETENFEKEGVIIEEKGFKDGKTLLKMVWKNLEIYGVKER